MKHVTQHSAEHLDRNPFPELHRSLEPNVDSEKASMTKDKAIEKSKPSLLPATAPGHPLESGDSGTLIYLVNERQTTREVEVGEVKQMLAYEVPSHAINDRSVRGAWCLRID